MFLSITVFGLVLPWLLVAVGLWLVYQLIRQNGRILLRLEALEGALRYYSAAEQPPASLAIGSVAPDFDLPDLSGSRQSLVQFRGRRVLLIFFSPQCGFCTKMLPRLAAVASVDKDDRPIPLLVTTGRTEVNRELMSKYGIGWPVLVQEQMEVATRYHANSTPTGYLIDEEGAIASALAVGADALLALLDGPQPARTGRNGKQAAVPGHPQSIRGKRIADSRAAVSTATVSRRAPPLRRSAYRFSRVGNYHWKTIGAAACS
jgi:peroxiredoxin